MFCRNYTRTISCVLCREVCHTAPLFGRVHYGGSTVDTCAKATIPDDTCDVCYFQVYIIGSELIICTYIHICLYILTYQIILYDIIHVLLPWICFS